MLDSRPRFFHLTFAEWTLLVVFVIAVNVALYLRVG